MKSPLQAGSHCLLILGLLACFDDTVALEFGHCQISHQAVSQDAECATLTVAENPAAPEGRQLELFVTRLPANTSNPESDAFTIIQGGPGSSSVDLGIQMRPVVDMIRRKRDVILIDQRGTGRSHQLQCELDEQNANFDLEQAAQSSRKCVEQLQAKADLRYYTTSVAVKDIEAVRAAAGYSQLSIYGASYGTRVAQHYLRRYPEQTRLLILDGVAQVGLNLAGPEIALRSQAAFDNLVERCAQSVACNQEMGDIQGKFENLRKRLSEQPITTMASDPISGKLNEQTLGEQDLLAAVRLMPYATESLALLPLLIAQAHAGDYRLLAAQSQLIQKQIADALALGMHNSVVCTEDEAFVDYDKVASAADTYFGDETQQIIQTSCGEWPRGVIDSDFHEPFDSTSPVLILSGETDPITPPENGERAEHMFSNSRHLVVPAHGHAVFNRGCVPFLINEFLDSGDVQALKISCIERERATPFFISANGPTP